VRSLSDLLSSAEGRRFLDDRGVLVDPARFVERLQPPRNPELAVALGLDPAVPLVYVGQQTLVDIPGSVLAKFRLSQQLGELGVSVALLWLDTDRAGSTKFATTIAWPGEPEPQSIRLVPQRLADRESRFAPVERERLEQVLGWLRSQLAAEVEGEARGAARERLQRLADHVLAAEPATLAEVNRSLGEFLLAERLGFAPAAITISEVARLAGFRQALVEALDSVEQLIVVFNEAVERLQAQDVDPQVHPLAADYLPLRATCECGTRLTVTRDGTAAHAVCRCGRETRFELPGDLPEAASVDVTLPLYLNDLTSGVVAGKSSALYGLVLEEVLERVLGREPVPAIVPPEPLDAAPDGRLLYDYLLAT
jgi:hypothetical protein